jgi:DNA-binding NarL/FixJ family response regulator
VARAVLDEFQRLSAKPVPAPSSTLPDTADAVHGAVAQSAVVEPLTPREEEVLLLLVEGLSNKEIGARLHLTEGTIKNYVSAIISKLQANDRTHAVVTALRRGLVEL